MISYVTIAVQHTKEIHGLSQMIAGRAYSIDGVTHAEHVSGAPASSSELLEMGFSMAEIALGSGVVERNG